MTKARSSVERELTQADKAELDGLILGRRMTLDEITGWLAERGYGISRSSVHRYAQTFDEKMQRLVESRERTAQILEQFAGKPATAMAEGASLVAQDLIMRRLLEVDGIDEETSIPDLVNALARLESSGVARERLKVQHDKGVTAGAAVVKAALRRELESDPDLRARMLELVDRAEAEARAA